MTWSSDKTRHGVLRTAVCLLLSMAMVVALVPGDGMAWAAERDLETLSSMAEELSSVVRAAPVPASSQGRQDAPSAGAGAGAAADTAAGPHGTPDADAAVSAPHDLVGSSAAATSDVRAVGGVGASAADGVAGGGVDQGPALVALDGPDDDPTDEDGEVATHTVTLDLGVDGAALDAGVGQALVSAGFAYDGGVWTGQVADGVTLAETIGVDLGDPAINGDSSTFFGWEVPDVYADTPETVHTRFVDGREWEKQPTGAEFMQYVNLAPQIGYWGTGRYVFDFDIKSLSTDLYSKINIYMQNGSTARYGLSNVTGVTTNYSLDVTTDYAHQHVISDISLSNPGVEASYLAFYGQYSIKVDGVTMRTYNIPFVKNMRVSRVGASSADVAGYPVDRDLSVTARWGTPCWRVSGSYLRFLTQIDGDAAVGGASALDLGGYASASEVPWYGSRASITTVLFETQIHGVTSMAHWFEGLYRLTAVSNLDKLDTSRTTDLRSLLSGCSAIKSLDLSPLDLSAANGSSGSMEGMLYGCSNLASVILPEVAGATTDIAFPQYYVHGHPSAGGWMNADDATTSYSPNALVGETLPAGSYVRRMRAMWRLTGDDDSYDGGASATELHFAMQLEDDDDATADGWSPVENDYSWDAKLPAWLSRADEIGRVVFDERVSGLVSGRALFAGLSSLAEFVGLGLLDTSAMTSMRDLFRGDASLVSVDVSTFDMRQVLDMSGMFRGCATLSELDVTTFVKNLFYSDCSYMFADCSSLEDARLGAIVGSGVSNASGMFLNCSSLTELDLSRCYFSSNLRNSVDVLVGCDSLVRVLLPPHSVYGGNSALPPLNSWFRFPEVTLEGEPCHWIWEQDPSVFCEGGAQVVMPEDNEIYGTWTREAMVPSWRLRGAGDAEPTEGHAADELHMATTWLHAVGTDGWQEIDASYGADSPPAWHAHADSITAASIDAPLVGVTSAAWWFSGLGRLAGVTGLDRIDTSALASAAHLFDGCPSLSALDLSGLDVSAVDDMEGMLDGCSGLTSIAFGSGDGFAASGDDIASDARRFHFPSYVAAGYNGRWSDGGSPETSYAPTDDMAGVTLVGTFVRQTSSIAIDLDGGALGEGDAQAMGALPRFVFDADATTWVGTAPGAATLADALGDVLFAPSKSGFFFMGWTLAVWHSDVETASADADVRYADVAPVVDLWGPGRYAIEFDVRSSGADQTDGVVVSLDGGGDDAPRYELVDGERRVDSPDAYARRRVMVRVGERDSSSAHAWLRFEGDAAHALSVKNVTVYRVRTAGAAASAVELDHDVTATADWAVPAWRLTGDGGEYDGTSSTELHFSMQPVDDDGGLDAGWGTIDAAYTADSHPAWHAAKTSVRRVVFDERVVGLTDISYWFRGFSSLEAVEGLPNLDASAVTRLVYTFYGCVSLGSLDLSGLDLSSLDNVDGMVAGCTSLRVLDFTGCVAPELARLSYCATGCSSLERVVLPTAPSVDQFNSTFSGCSSLRELDLSGLGLSSGPVGMVRTFENCSSLEHVVMPAAPAVTSLESTFSGCSSLRDADLSGLDLSSRDVSLRDAFSGCALLERVVLPDVSAANTTLLAFPAYKAVGRTTAGRWCNVATPELTYAAGEAVGAALPAGTYGWAAVAMWRLTGDGGSALGNDGTPTELHFSMQPVDDAGEGWAEVGNAYSYNGLAAGTTRPPWQAYATTITKVVMDNYVRDLTSANGLFSNLGKVTEYVNFDWFDTSKVTSMRNMFLANGSLSRIDLSAFDTSTTRDMAGLFQNCGSLVEVDLSGCSAPDLVDTLLMFGSCASLARVEMGGLVTSATTNLKQLFNGCSNLVELDLSGCDLSGGSASTIVYMLDGCVALERVGLPAGTVNDFRFPQLVLDGGTASWVNADDLGESYVSGVALGQTNFGGGIYVRDAVVTTYRLTGDGGAAVGPGDMPTELHLKSQLAGGVDEGWETMDGAYSATQLPPWHTYASTLAKVVLDGRVLGATSTAWWFADLANVTVIEHLAWLNTAKVEDMRSMFRSCGSLVSLDVSAFRTSRATTMGGMFDGCASLASLDVSRFDTSRVEDMGWLFRGCESLATIDVSRWDTGTVANMEGLFDQCHALRSLDVSGWDTSRAKSMLGMFRSCKKLKALDVSGFVTDQAEDMRSMFSGCRLLEELDVSGFGSACATSLSSLFAGCETLAHLDLSGFDARAVSDMTDMLDGCDGLVSVKLGRHFSFSGAGISDVSKRAALPAPVDMATYTDKWLSADAVEGTARTGGELAASFDGARMAGTWRRVGRLEGTACALLLAEGSTVALPVYGVTPAGAKLPSAATFVVGDDEADEAGYLAGTLLFVRSLDDSLSGASTTITDIYGSSYDGVKVYPGVESYQYDEQTVSLDEPATPWGVDRAEIFHVDVASEQTIRPTSVGGLFCGLSNATSMSLAGLDTSGADTLAYLFAGCSGLSGLDVSGLACGTADSLRATFMGCAGLEELDLAAWDLSGITSTQDMLAGCTSLERVVFPSPMASRLENVSRMFAGCSSLLTVDVAGWDMSAATRMGGMFDGCLGLAELDLSDWDVPNVDDLSGFARGCGGLTSLDLSGFDTTHATDLTDMLAGCVGLERVTFHPDGRFAADGDAIVATSAQFHFPAYVSGTTHTGRWASEGDAYESYAGGAATDMGSVTLGGSYVRQSAIPVWRLTAADGVYDGDAAAELHFAMGGVSHEEGWEPIANNYTWSGSGEDTTTTPWLAHADAIERVVIDGRVSGLTSGRALFYGLWRVTDFSNLASLDTGAMTSMTDMFSGCRSVTRIDVSGFDTSKARDLRYLFQSCSNLREVDVSTFDAGLVGDVYHMFQGCTSLEDVTLGSVVTGRARNVGGMFLGCASLSALDLSACDLSGVTNGADMLSGCSALARIELAAAEESAPSLSWFRFPAYAADGATTGRWANVGALDGMAYDAESSLAGVTLTGTWMRQPTAGAYAVLGHDGTLTFFRSHNAYVDGTTAFVDGNGDAHDVFTDVDGVGRGGIVYAGFEDVEAFADAADVPWHGARGDVAAVAFLEGQAIAPQSVAWWFEGCDALEAVVGLGHLDTTGSTSMAHLFDGCSSLADLDVSGLDTGSVRDMGSMFAGCAELATIDVSDFDMGDVQSIARMFDGCEALGSLDLSRWHTDSLADMGDAFHGCEMLAELDLSPWDVPNLGKVDGAFSGCAGLVSIDLPDGFVTSAVTDLSRLFSGCASLPALDLTGFDTSAVSDMGDMFLGTAALASIGFGAGFSFKGKGSGDIAAAVGRQALLCTPAATGRRTGKWMLTGDDEHAWTAAELRDGGVVPRPGTYVWEDGCYVTYDPGSTAISAVGTPDPQRVLVSHGDELTSPEIAEPVGYALDGWYRDGSASDRVVFAGGQGTPTIVTGDLSLVARYSPTAGFVVRFAPNAAEAESREPGVLHADADVARLPADRTGLGWEDANVVRADADAADSDLGQAPELAGYRFVGWYLEDGVTRATKASAYGELALAHAGAEASGQDADPTAAGSEPVREITLYAHWELEPDAGNAYAVLSGDGVLTFFRSERTYENGREYAADTASDLSGTTRRGFVWGAFEGMGHFASVSEVPWATHMDRIRSVVVAGFEPGGDDGRRQVVRPLSMAHWFHGASGLAAADLAGFDTSHTTSMASTFRGCSSLERTVAFEGVETDSLVDIADMWRGCSRLVSADFASFDTAGVADMHGLLADCTSLTTVDLSTLDASGANDLSSLVEGCSSLKSLTLGDPGSTRCVTSAATDLSRMFAGCTRLVALDVAALDTRAATDLSGMFSGCSSLRRVVLGPSFGFAGGDGTTAGTLPARCRAALPDAPSDGIYTGTWDRRADPAYALGASELAGSYVGRDMCGEWEWGYGLPLAGGVGEDVAFRWAAVVAIAASALVLRRRRRVG